MDRISTNCVEGTNPACVKLTRYTPNARSCATYRPSSPTSKFKPELIPFAHQFTCRRERRPLRVVHLYPKLSPIPLRGSGKNEETHHPQKQEQPSHEWHYEPPRKALALGALSYI